MRVLSVNTAKRTVIRHRGKDIVTGIRKRPVSGSIRVTKTHIEGDEQADKRHHGGADQALCLFPAEHYKFYRERLGVDREHYGHVGENLTTEGVSESSVRVGDRFTLGTATFEVSQPRTPCAKLAMQLGGPEAVRLMVETGKTGFYLRVIEAGEIRAGDLTRVSSDPNAPTVLDLHNLLYFDLTNARLLQAAVESAALGKSWRDNFRVRLKTLGS